MTKHDLLVLAAIWPLALLVVGVFELARRAIFGWEH